MPLGIGERACGLTNVVVNQYPGKPGKDVYFSGSHQRFAHAERSLWVSVLLAMVHDLHVGNYKDRTDAERWVGTFPTADFTLVVTLAGLEPDSVWERLRHVCAMTTKERRQFAHRNGSWNFGVKGRKEIAA